MKIETKILSHLVYDEKYLRKVLPFIKDVYFEVLTEKIIFQEIQQYMNNYDGLPSANILQIEVEKRKDISEEIFKGESDGIIERLPYPSRSPPEHGRIRSRNWNYQDGKYEFVFP